MEPQEVDELIRQLVRIAVHQDTINADLREFNRQQIAINQRLEVTQARIETLLARMIAQGENGQEA